MDLAAAELVGPDASPASDQPRGDILRRRPRPIPPGLVRVERPARDDPLISSRPAPPAKAAGRPEGPGADPADLGAPRPLPRAGAGRGEPGVVRPRAARADRLSHALGAAWGAGAGQPRDARVPGRRAL